MKNLHNPQMSEDFRMVGVARIELATPTMSTHGTESISAEKLGFPRLRITSCRERAVNKRLGRANFTRTSPDNFNPCDSAETLVTRITGLEPAAPNSMEGSRHG